MANIKVVIFSKNRQMQLHGFLESLGNYKFDRYVITPNYDITYKEVMGNFPDVNWILEESNGLEKTLKNLINSFNDDDYILFGCDDVIYTKTPDLLFGQFVLETNNDTIGFSYRLGRNIQYSESIENLSTDRHYLKWNWRSPVSYGDFAYPFELMATMYRCKMVKYLLKSMSGILTPNRFEDLGYAYCNNNYVPDCLACSDNVSIAYAQDVNRVQDQYPNRINGDDRHNISLLDDLYRQGFRIDLRKLKDAVNNTPFIGMKYWSTKQI